MPLWGQKPERVTVGRDSLRRVVSMANDGMPLQQHTAGEWYFSGDNLPQDYGRAVAWWSRAAKQGYAPSFARLARCFHKGLGVEADSMVAVRLYREAYAKGCGECIRSLEVLADSGEVLPAAVLGEIYGEAGDAAKAELYLAKAASAGDTGSRRRLGALLHNAGRTREAAEWWKAGAEDGDPECAFRYGIYLQPSSPFEAVEWIVRASDSGYAPALRELGLACRDGNGIGKDTPKAFRLLLEAAGKDDVPAQWALGLLYASAPSPDYHQAVMWLSKAVRGGYEPDMASLRTADSPMLSAYLDALAALLVRGSHEDALKSLKPMLKAGIPAAESLQGMILASPTYKKHNKKKSEKMLRKAAGKGDTLAIDALGSPGESPKAVMDRYFPEYVRDFLRRI